ncbi:MAG: phosphopantothenoylcysteine decarboxylase / phosphopantothenate---cysteine ligase [Myxococcales bacterium]|jgi:phosphopantothenoylcysteine decarboxylase/phosphopantothenate--cysteine ligase|nr:phosphopantothenoylcysteine decarboxylase / phosphopantothenate---cysteine ligase [Myxococcales bacterium]
MTGVGSLKGRVVVFGVTGGIAAYKAPEICRLLVKAGASVQVIMTPAAAHFVTPLTLQTVSGQKVARDLFDLTEESEIGHVRRADQADLLLVAPATADFIARMAAGMADDLLSTVALATRAPILIAPAMNVNMWENPMTQANLARLLGRPGPAPIATVGPDRGPLACGWVGAGRLIDPEVIVAEAARMLAPGDLDGVRVVVTAGPTFEAIDDVRFIGNRSSGKMGFAVAAAAAARGAQVTLIAGPVGLPTPARVVARIDVESAEQMGGALRAATAGADVVVMAAAVADFRPTVRSAGKLSRRLQPTDLAVALTPNPDLLADIARTRPGKSPLLVGFAAETAAEAALAARARAKLVEKGCDVIVANDVGAPGIGFGADDNAVTVLFADGRQQTIARAPKTTVADRLWSLLLPAIAAVKGASQEEATAVLSAERLPHA